VKEDLTLIQELRRAKKTKRAVEMSAAAAE